MKKIFKSLLLILLFALTACEAKTENIDNPEEEPYPIEQPTPEFDSSIFKQLTKEEALALYDMEGVQIVFACTASSSSCQEVYNAVVKVQNDFKYTTNYLYIYGSFVNEFRDFISKLDMNYSINDTINGSFKELIGGSKVYFPAIIIIKDGKQVDGLIGIDINYQKLKDIVSKYLK